MVEGAYERELRDVRVLLNAKNVLQNFRYKIMKDKNTKDFFENLIVNAAKYDDMERMEKYYFNGDLKIIHEVVNLFMEGLKSEFKEREGSEFMKCCNLFPDNAGRECMYIVSHIPLVNLLNEKRKYSEYVEKYSKVPEGEEDSHRWDIREHQKEVLFNEDSMMHRAFPKDRDLLNYDLRNEHIEFVKRKYEDEGKLETINNEIDSLVSVFDHIKNPEDFKQLKWDFGVMYWDGMLKKEAQKSQKMKEVFGDIIKALSKDKD